MNDKKWEEICPGVWHYDIEFGPLRVDDGEGYAEPEDEGKFRAYWTREDAEDIGWFDTIEKAKAACVANYGVRVEDVAFANGYVQNMDEDCWEEEAPSPELGVLKSHVEQLQVQLAGCGVAALGGTSEKAVVGDFGWSPTYEEVLNLRNAYDRLCYEAATYGDGTFYCEGPNADMCPWRKKGVHRCLAPEGYKDCKAESIGGVTSRVPEEELEQLKQDIQNLKNAGG